MTAKNDSCYTSVMATTQNTSTKIYPIRCHVCGAEFDLEAEFISGLPSTHDGRLSGTCNMSDDQPHHTSDEIRASWNARHSS